MVAGIPKLRVREELAAFLRAQRSKLSPEQVGLPRGMRRRVRGLRREEVALLAGVGLTWYTWLEQAKDIRVSPHFLERLSKALRLDSAEKKHLFALGQVPFQECSESSRFEVSENLKRMLEAFPGPAYMLTTRRWDMIYWNTAVTALCGPFPINDPNAMELMFLDKYHMSLMHNWEPWARKALAKFKLDVAPFMNDPDVVELIEKLRHGSEAFRQWWPESQVVGRDEEARTYVHPEAGKLTFTPAAFVVEHVPGVRFRAHTPVDTSTTEKMRHLIDRLRDGKAKSQPRPKRSAVR